jgi:hypothetical protein
MKKGKTLVLAALALLSGGGPMTAQVPSDFHSNMVNSTFLIAGPSAKAAKKLNCGSGFLMGTPAADAGRFNPVLVTAAHVLEGMSGETVQLVIRVKDAQGGLSRRVVSIRFRSGRVPLYTKHPYADVAVMYLPLPHDHSLTFTRSAGLATDSEFARLELHPGDEMLTVGFPYCSQLTNLGYGILRKGIVATPVTGNGKILDRFFLDMPAVGGNSGGAVYFEYYNRFYGNVLHPNQVSRWVAGVMTVNASGPGGQVLGVAGVVPARFIDEAMKLLPAPPHDLLLLGP